MLLEVPLVIGRDTAGKAFALRDICPHRAFPLSFGQFDGTAVECAYHGWQFDAHTGQCLTIPSLTADSKLKCERIFAGSFPCAESDGYIYVLMTNPEGRSSISAGTAAGASTTQPRQRRITKVQREPPVRAPLGRPALRR